MYYGMTRSRLVCSFILLVILVSMMAWLVTKQHALQLIEHGIVLDTDGYVHLLRLRSIIEHGGWNQGFIERDNAPWGFHMHWSKPFDLIILAVAAPFLIIGYDSDQILLLVGGFSGPVFLVALGMTLLWAVKPVLCPNGRLAFAALFGTSIALFSYGSIGRVDHHILSLIPVAAALGGVIRQGFARHPKLHPSTYSLFTGLCCAVALWISVETTAAITLVLGLAFLIRVEESGRRPLWPIGVALPISSGLFILIDPPSTGFLAPDIDRISIVSVGYGVALLCSMIVTDLLVQHLPRGWSLRFLVLLSGTASASSWLMTFPAVIAGPESIMGPELTRIWWNNIQELQPIRQTADFSAYVGLSSLAAVGCLTGAGISAKHRKLFLYAAAASLATTVLALNHIRFYTYSVTTGAIICALLIGRLSVVRRCRSPIMVVNGLIVLIIANMAMVVAPAIIFPKTKNMVACDILSIVPFLETLNAGSPDIIMTTPGYAPEILWRTHHGTVAGPYQRNIEGLRDVYQFFGSADDDEAKAIMSRRGSHYVLVCADRNLADDGRHGLALLEKLRNGNEPRWLDEIPLSEATLSGFRLYRVAD